MKRYCPYCAEFEEDPKKRKAKILKEPEPQKGTYEINGKEHPAIITHRCENCGASFGEGVPE